MEGPVNFKKYCLRYLAVCLPTTLESKDPTTDFDTIRHDRESRKLPKSRLGGTRQKVYVISIRTSVRRQTRISSTFQSSLFQPTNPDIIGNNLTFQSSRLEAEDKRCYHRRDSNGDTPTPHCRQRHRERPALLFRSRCFSKYLKIQFIFSDAVMVWHNATKPGHGKRKRFCLSRGFYVYDYEIILSIHYVDVSGVAPDAAPLQ